MSAFSEMTSRALHPRWIVCLTLVLVCQTARLVEGHPHALTEPLPDAGSSSTQPPQDTTATDTSVSRLIETAYENQELLRPEHWPRRPDGTDDERTGQMQLDTSKLGSSNDETMQYRKRKLLEMPVADRPMHRDSDEKIIFPDSRVPSILPSAPTALPAAACHKSTFCENVPDYPRQLVNAAIARNASLRFLEIIDPMPDIEQRIDTPDESPLCRFREQVVYPQIAQNKEKQWLYIANQDNLKQGIRIEVCQTDGQECSMIGGFAEGYKTTCKQKFIYRELATVASDGNIVKDQFRFPSSCCCHVRFTGDPTVRSGLGSDLQTNRTLVTQYK